MSRKNGSPSDPPASLHLEGNRGSIELPQSSTLPPLERLFQSFLAEIPPQPGHTFLQSLTLHLQSSLQADVVIIGVIHLHQPRHIKTVAVSQNGIIIDNFECEVVGTPCETLFARPAQLHHVDVQHHFPKVDLFRQLGISSYVGCPLYDSSQQPIGILIALFRNRLSQPHLSQQFLQTFASRVAAELERRRVEVALRESESQLRTMVEHAPEALVLVDTETGHFVNMNDNARSLFELPEADVLQVRFFDLCPPRQPNGWQSHSLARRQFKEALADHRPVFDWTIQTPSGRTVPCEVRLIRFPSSEHRLVRGSLADISQRKQAEAERDRLMLETQQARDQLRQLSSRLVAVQEEERRRLARELHDEIGQKLTALKLTLARLPNPDPNLSPTSPLQEAQEQVNDILSRVRQISLDLRPTMLDDLGLVPALLWLFDRLAASCPLTVDFRHAGLEAHRFHPEIETAAYRIVQEAITNVIRHAQTDRAHVRIWKTPDLLCLSILDPGVGFHPENVWTRHNSNGLSSMRERSKLLNGSFTIESAPGHGTQITAELPILPPDLLS